MKDVKASPSQEPQMILQSTLTSQMSSSKLETQSQFYPTLPGQIPRVLLLLVLLLKAMELHFQILSSPSTLVQETSELDPQLQSQFLKRIRLMSLK